MIEGSEASFKFLRLITPQKANELGVPAETPLLVSSFQNTECTCDECHEQFSPLIYRVGAETKSQHFHGSTGGIYYFNGGLERLLEGGSTNYDWIVSVAPKGEIYENSLSRTQISGRVEPPPSFKTFQAESVVVTNIKAVNMADQTTGQLYKHPYDGTLIPAPIDGKDSKESVCLFEITDRGLRFSYPNNFPAKG